MTDPSSPTHITWTDLGNNGPWKVNLTTDYATHNNPCNQNTKDPTYAWFVLKDQTGPFPAPGKTLLKMHLRYNLSGDNGSSRVLIGWQGGPSGKYLIETVISSNNWWVADPNDPLVTDAYTYPQGIAIGIKGSGIGLSLPTNQEIDITYDLGDLLSKLSIKGTLPNEDWINSMRTQTLYVGTEVSNIPNQGNLKTDLAISNFRIESK